MNILPERYQNLAAVAFNLTLIFILVIITGLAILLLLGPVVSNVFSNIHNCL